LVRLRQWQKIFALFLNVFFAILAVRQRRTTGGGRVPPQAGFFAGSPQASQQSGPIISNFFSWIGGLNSVKLW